MRHSCSFSFSQGRAQTHISFFAKNNLQFIFEFTRQSCLRAISNKACLNKGMLKEVAQDFRVGYLVTSKFNKQWLIMNEAIKSFLFRFMRYDCKFFSSQNQISRYFNTFNDVNIEFSPAA